MLEVREVKKNFTVRLKPSTIKQIEEIAKKYNQSKAYIIEKSIESLIKQETKDKGAIKNEW